MSLENYNTRIEAAKVSLGLADYKFPFSINLLRGIEYVLSEVAYTFAQRSSQQIEELERYVEFRENEEEIDLPDWEDLIERENEIDGIASSIEVPDRQLHHYQLPSFEDICTEGYFDWTLNTVETLVCADIIEILEARLKEYKRALSKQRTLIRQFEKIYEPYRKEFAKLKSDDYEHEYSELENYSFDYPTEEFNLEARMKSYGLLEHEYDVLRTFEKYLVELFQKDLTLHKKLRERFY